MARIYEELYILLSYERNDKDNNRPKILKPMNIWIGG
ncbi:unnamed protein product [Paramecium octaurelia]|uniref:Uncharacterized protein n=1 Tax=Paramecium octaurelia TaxID=43137 RepID=A0A8S1Y154_PAROT|nr:unnamed protein product [Paramecium octaurelia]